MSRRVRKIKIKTNPKNSKLSDKVKEFYNKNDIFLFIKQASVPEINNISENQSIIFKKIEFKNERIVKKLFWGFHFMSPSLINH